ncbi:Maleylacetoacetate isomerase [Vanrija pseudolonga]|uniref:Maleylacetoacetate isomerase n=1 Tax=Vanrija pseudolonga TaxID=143232 RepID=A0AAF0Y135_9TREE|nr:Maleylacetoacetate isomerase [Vanrija pseudolonga]
MTTPQPKLTLYTYFRSSAATRVRTVLALHGVPHEQVFIHLLKGEQRTPAYLQHNPSAAVPALHVTDGSGGWDLTQSAAIMEYVDEVFGAASPRGSLMPKDARGRALVRSIVDILVCDMQPLANLKVLTRVKALAGDEAAMPWAKEWCEAGMKALEAILSKTAGTYAYGDSLTLADVALAPQMNSCIRFGVRLEDYPVAHGVFTRVSALPEFVSADWRHQPDTPDEFKA